jgi:hypothetical protein
LVRVPDQSRRLLELEYFEKAVKMLSGVVVVVLPMALG